MLREDDDRLHVAALALQVARVGHPVHQGKEAHPDEAALAGSDDRPGPPPLPRPPPGERGRRIRYWRRRAIAASSSPSAAHANGIRRGQDV